MQGIPLTANHSFEEIPLGFCEVGLSVEKSLLTIAEYVATSTSLNFVPDGSFLKFLNFLKIISLGRSGSCLTVGSAVGFRNSEDMRDPAP